jgi:alkanesulfonate monooxygenase SsuD/methylene tetrahydromethanopterin reductase-like flavin-dependent oxidoreductase (luciferase family)
MFYKNDLFHTTMAFDMRAPDFGAPVKDIYHAALEMAQYADEKGIDRIDYQEHHQSEDGYLSAPFLMSVAAASRTKRINFVNGAVILPLHDPVKVAEQIAHADHISDGRIRTVLAAGYSATEFAAFRVSLKDRARLMEEGFDIILRALSGERFKDKDREVFVRPLPGRPITDIVFGGGGSAPAARRAARFGLGMWPMNDEIVPVYHEECKKLGKTPGKLMRSGHSCFIYEDIEQGWKDIGPHVLHYARSYAAWSGSYETSTSPLHGLTTPEKVRASGLFQVVTPEQAVEIGKKGPIGLQPLIGGLSPKIGWKILERFAEKVLPHIKGSMQANAV